MENRDHIQPEDLTPEDFTPEERAIIGEVGLQDMKEEGHVPPYIEREFLAMIRNETDRIPAPAPHLFLGVGKSGVWAALPPNNVPYFAKEGLPPVWGGSPN